MAAGRVRSLACNKLTLEPPAAGRGQPIPVAGWWTPPLYPGPHPFKEPAH